MAPPSDDPSNPDPAQPAPSFPKDQPTTPDPVDPNSKAVPQGTKSTSPASNCLPVGGSPSQFDPGSIISDQVFYNTDSMTPAEIGSFIGRLGADCTDQWCLKNLTVTVPDYPQNRYCAAYTGGVQTAAVAIAGISKACGINPQVMLVTLQKESGLLTRTDVSKTSWDAAWGWFCPDTGPGGSANCDSAHGGFLNQLYGMAQQWTRYRLDPEKYNYHAGQVANVAWNVAESGCGSSPVFIRNTATASLYDYTPYQPNAASLAAYPAAGDKCSSYGNRNFFVLFGQYFGGSGAGAPPAVNVSGTTVSIPTGPDVDPTVAGQQIVAPDAAVARGLAAGLGAVGLPYVWGGGTDGGGPDQGCARAGGASNSCQGIVGFDCSGLTGFVMSQAGFATGTDSASQRAGGERIPWDKALPGDIIGYPGHVAIYLGLINGAPYLLEAPGVGHQVQVRTVHTNNIDPVVHRYWR
ncbi:MAG: NlpC/P60 family protein [Actinomycetota bacterium]|nr:NlpC/P60 family protein [Actinomycetota bacterium]